MVILVIASLFTMLFNIVSFNKCVYLRRGEKNTLKESRKDVIIHSINLISSFSYLKNSFEMLINGKLNEESMKYIRVIVNIVITVILFFTAVC